MGKQAPMSTFLAKGGDSIPNDLARLAGRASGRRIESGDRRRLDEATVKR
jgi:hypothetical protein